MIGLEARLRIEQIWARHYARQTRRLRADLAAARREIRALKGAGS